jgi:ribose 5-phosphate isomerase A
MSEAQLGAKRRVAERACNFIEPGMIVGLGSGSTAALVIDEIGRRLERGVLSGILCIPTSRVTSVRALARGIPLTTLEQHPSIDLTIDGADEIDPAGNLLKGAGGALLMEKIVATCTRRLVIVADSTKLVPRLGVRHPLPIEVVQFGWSTHLDTIRALGGDPRLRREENGLPYQTDEGHFIVDAWFSEGLTAPGAIHRALLARPGVVETGLFMRYGPELIIGDAGR